MFRSTSVALLALALSAHADQPSSTPATLQVRLPADAVLEIDGYRTRSTGVVRLFASPPLERGKSYPYLLKALWHGKEAVREVMVKPDEVTVVELKKDDFQAAAEVKAPVPAANGEQPAAAPAPKKPPMREGFVVLEREGRWWIFREGSKEAADYQTQGEPDKHVTRLNVLPYRVTFKAPDPATLEDYLATRAGFVVKFEDGRLWVFKIGSKELDEFKKNGELAKHIVRPGAGPNRTTLKGPDAETLDDYLKASD
jgi:uncharacterized protein (TIGR03000 family)